MSFAPLAARLSKDVNAASRIGIGTGRTVDAVLKDLRADLSARKGELQLVASSYATARVCSALGIPCVHPGTEIPYLDLYIDGADEIDPEGRLIKGRGGAMLREKILAELSNRFIVIADTSKRVSTLGSKFAVPIEVIPEALDLVTRRVASLGADLIEVRSGASGKHGPCITESGNLILDARFSAIPDTLETDLKKIVGVVESGLFLSQATSILILEEGGNVTALDGPARTEKGPPHQGSR